MRVDQTIDIDAALSKLEPRQRAALIFWCQGYTHDEIAEKMGVSSRTVKRYTLDARKQMAVWLK